MERCGGVVASRTLDPRVVRSSPGLSVTRSWAKQCTQIVRVFSDRTLKIVGPLCLVSVPRGSNRSHLGYIKMWHWLRASCARQTAVGGAARDKRTVLGGRRRRQNARVRTPVDLRRDAAGCRSRTASCSGSRPVYDGSGEGPATAARNTATRCNSFLTDATVERPNVSSRAAG